MEDAEEDSRFRLAKTGRLSQEPVVYRAATCPEHERFSGFEPEVGDSTSGPPGVDLADSQGKGNTGDKRQTDSTDALFTSSLALFTSALALSTSALALFTSSLVLFTSSLALFTSALALSTSSLALSTSSLALFTSANDFSTPASALFTPACARSVSTNAFFTSALARCVSASALFTSACARSVSASALFASSVCSIIGMQAWNSAEHNMEFGIFSHQESVGIGATEREGDEMARSEASATREMLRIPGTEVDFFSNHRGKIRDFL